MILTFLIMWILANKKDEKKLKINSTNIVIKYGDLFEEEGLKVIAFNEFFDTQVDDKVIATSSLNGIFITEHSDGASTIDNKIDSEIRLKQSIISENVHRKFGGKTTRYKLGCVCPYYDYFLLSF